MNNNSCTRLLLAALLLSPIALSCGAEAASDPLDEELQSLPTDDEIEAAAKAAIHQDNVDDVLKQLEQELSQPADEEG